ncbi:hypothetical protein HG543_38840, partial [Pyxidicoccus fallax]|nr:hypothetical protein [Pyxidicoccus fallax]
MNRGSQDPRDAAPLALERLPPNALTLFRLSGLIRVPVYGVLGVLVAFVLSRTGLGGW